MSTSTPRSRLQELLPQMFQATELPGQPYLRFQLTAEIKALLSMEHVRESLLVPARQITPLPNMPETVIGLMSSRERVFCAIELDLLFGLRPSPVYSRQYHIVVLRVSQSSSQQSSSEQELLLGIAVSSILGITRLISENLQLPRKDFASNLKSYLQGYVVEKEERLLVLDARSIINASLLYNDRA